MTPSLFIQNSINEILFERLFLKSQNSCYKGFFVLFFFQLRYLI